MIYGDRYEEDEEFMTRFNQDYEPYVNEEANLKFQNLQQ